MRILIPALAAASLLMVSLPGYSADDVKAGGASTKPARALDDGAVKSGGGADKPGRALDDNAVIRRRRQGGPCSGRRHRQVGCSFRQAGSRSRRRKEVQEEESQEARSTITESAARRFRQ